MMSYIKVHKRELEQARCFTVMLLFLIYRFQVDNYKYPTVRAEEKP